MSDHESPAIVQESPMHVSTPSTRKRISMNFSLPVVSAGSPPVGRRTSSISAQTTPVVSISSPLVGYSSSTDNQPVSPSRNKPNDGFEHDHSSSSAPSTSTNNSSNVPISPGSSANGTSSSSTASFNTYLNELATRERRVVELRDEVKRLQDTLKRAEMELNQFKEGAAHALARPSRPRSSSSHYMLQNSENHRRSDSIESKALPPDIPDEKDEQLQLEDYKVVDPSQPIRALHTSMGRSQLPPSGDVLNMGKRVVEELGSQFWGFFDDIKNAAIGEDAREYPYRQPIRHRHSKQLKTPPQPATEPTVEPPRRDKGERRASINDNASLNSYYML